MRFHPVLRPARLLVLAALLGAAAGGSQAQALPPGVRLGMTGEELLAAPSNGSIYVLRMTANADLTWVRQIGPAVIDGSDEEGTVASRAIALDAAGNVFTVGDFAGVVDFDPGTGLTIIDEDKSGNTPALPGQFEASDTFIQKMDPDGNFLEVKRFGGDDGTTLAHDAAIDASGGINIVGAFSGFVVRNRTSGAFRRSTEDERGDSNVFLVKLLG